MNTHYSTRNTTETLSPEGDIFLPNNISTEELVPSFIADILRNLPRYRRGSMIAKYELHEADLEWDEQTDEGVVRSQGYELGLYLSDRSKQRDDRSQDPMVAEKIMRIEQLKDQASEYRSKQSLIRQTANEIGSLLLTKMSIDQAVEVGLHTYGAVNGPFDHTFFCRLDTDEHMTLFNWDGLLDDQHYRHATFHDQVVLLSDIILHNGD